MTHQFWFEVVSKLVLQYETGTSKYQRGETKLFLNLSKNLDKSKYLDSSGLPSKDGSAAVTDTLVQALVANIHNAHQRGYRNSADHLRYVISALGRGVDRTTEAGEGNYYDDDFDGSKTISSGPLNINDKQNG